MGAITLSGHHRLDRSQFSLRRWIGAVAMAVGLADAMLLAMINVVWIFDPAQAPSFRAALVVPILALAVLFLAPFTQSRIDRPGRQVRVAGSAARWWALFALLLSGPALLLVGML